MIKKLTSGLFAAALVMALPLTANAQEAAAPADEVEICTATIAPIHASESVAVTATFDAPFGKVVGIEAPAESGLVLVEEKPIAMADEAVEGDIEAEVEPVPLTDENANVSTFWLNSSETEPGTYLLTLSNEAGESCTAEINVESNEQAEKSDEWNEGDTEIEAEVEETEDGEEY